MTNVEQAASTTTLTLTDFLLARIAEDEAVAREARQREYLDYRRESSVIHWENDVSGYAFIRATSGRVLAECEAKRRLVEWHGTGHVCEDGWVPAEDDPQWDEENPATREPCHVLCILSLPYADHPDYRPEWRG